MKNSTVAWEGEHFGQIVEMETEYDEGFAEREGGLPDSPLELFFLALLQT
jgi:hypothetical protein